MTYLLNLIFIGGFVYSTAFAFVSQTDTANPCLEDTRNSQFDFWVGEWDVFVDGEKVAESQIEQTLNGCLIIENYQNIKSGYAGKSMNFFDVEQQKWVQIWTDIAGNVSRYTGQLKDGKMFFKGTNLSRGGKRSRVRMEFTPNPDGSVRQLYQESADGGKTWKTLFDGTYRTAKSGN